MEQVITGPMSPKFARPLAEAAVAETGRRQGDGNVVCVGFGLKYVKGRPTMQAALQYHVRRKLASDEEIHAAGSERIPAEVDGYPTDVLTWSLDKALACPDSKPPTGERGGRKEDPLVGGTSTTSLSDFHSFPTGYGTLGGLCFDATSGAAMALSNAHVYGFATGSDVIQPWVPTTEYLEAVLEYLTCGGPLTHLFFWTAPSPLTSILTGAATAAWIAAIASDAEDPSRWGQRTGPAPVAGAVTSREKIRLKASVPHMPFPGRVWESDTSWDYARVTSAGTLAAATSDSRPNEHVLMGKRVLTDRPRYTSGDVVTLCAELFDRVDVPASAEVFTIPPVERFVVAHCFPLDDPSRVQRRVMAPDRGRCGKAQAPEPVCIKGFERQVAGVEEVSFRVIADPFILFSNAPTTALLDAAASDNPAGVNAIRIPSDTALTVVCPPSTRVQVSVFSQEGPVEAVAFSANGTRADVAQSTGARGAVETIELTGLEIVNVELRGRGYLSGICADKRRLPPDLHANEVARSVYTATLKLGAGEPAGTWAVTVVSQTLDNTPTGGDPLQAARSLGGIADSANVVEVGTCACTVLFDATFPVSRAAITILT